MKPVAPVRTIFIPGPHARRRSGAQQLLCRRRARSQRESARSQRESMCVSRCAACTNGGTPIAKPLRRKRFMKKMDSPLRIALISEHASPIAAVGGTDAGGQNVYVAHIARCLAQMGHHVDVLTRRDSPHLAATVDVRA